MSTLVRMRNGGHIIIIKKDFERAMGCDMEQGHLCEQYSLLLEMKIRLNERDIYI
jgi:hypothetical protein